MHKISVIIPVHNGERHINEAIEAARGQSRLPDEIIVVDDGSTDDTRKVVQAYDEVRYFYQEKSGVARAVNRGIKESEGTVLAFLDHDDLWHPSKLQKQIEVLNSGSHDMVFSLTQNFLSPETSKELAERLEFEKKPMVGIQKSAMMVTREAFFKVGVFPEDSKIELLNWYARAKDVGLSEKVIEEILVRRRIHGNNQSILDRSLRMEFPRIIKTILDQRRKNQ